jgi:hypothetical protein
VCGLTGQYRKCGHVFLGRIGGIGFGGTGVPPVYSRRSPSAQDMTGRMPVPPKTCGIYRGIAETEH